MTQHIGIDKYIMHIMMIINFPYNLINMNQHIGIAKYMMHIMIIMKSIEPLVLTLKSGDVLCH